MEKIFSHTWRDKRGLGGDKEGEENKKPQEEFVDDDQGLQRRHAVDTTLLLHFFGKKGKDELKYEGFKK
jgi:calcium uptake protein 3, mitochondrial